MCLTFNSKMIHTLFIKVVFENTVENRKNDLLRFVTHILGQT